MSGLKKVFLSGDVHLVCMTHALSTEVEEVMGLLIGWTNKQGECYISHCVQLKRLDKRKDRVEISVDQLVAIFPIVEELNKDKRLTQPNKWEEDLRVVGWYHSHPHITVFPSKVDIRTQNQYQSQMDPDWVGLIFGVFNEDKQGAGHIPYIAFQARDNSAAVALELSKALEEAGEDASDFGVTQKSPTPSPSSAHQDHTSNDSELKHQLIPIFILPVAEKQRGDRRVSLLGKSAIRSLVQLPQLLFNEVEEVYERKKHNRLLDAVAGFHSASVFAQSTCNVLGRLARPLIHTLELRQKIVAQQIDNQHLQA